MTYILLVEDESLIAALLADKIKGLTDRTLVTCYDTKKAFEHISKELPHIAFLDVNLGNELCFDLALSLRDDNVPIYFLTSYSRESLQNLGLPSELEEVELLSKLSTSSKYFELINGLQSSQRI